MRLRVILGAALAVVRGLSAQSTQPSPRTAAIIDDAALARHIAVIADDSMLGRDTPSRGLEQTARYVAERFKTLGLKLLGDSVVAERANQLKRLGLELPGDSVDAYILRYSIPRQSMLDDLRSSLTAGGRIRKGATSVVGENGERVGREYTIDFRSGSLVLASDTVLDCNAPGSRGGGQSFEPGGPAPVLFAGRHTLESVRRANVRDRVVVYVPPVDGDSAVSQQIVQTLRASNHMILVADEDSATFAARRRAAQAHPPTVLGGYLPEAQQFRRWAVYAWAPALQGWLANSGFNLATDRAAPTPIVREMAGIAGLSIELPAPGTGASAPNVIGLLPGRDHSQVVVFTAHMDHTGLRRGQPDSIANGANDNASGVAGLLELVRAFAESKAPPQRSIAFVAVSGGAKEFWGSSSMLQTWPFFTRDQVVMNINLDMIGRMRDSVYIDGMSDLDLPVRPTWLANEHPELGVTVVDGGSAVAGQSDHSAFVRRAIPSLYVHGENHGAHDADGDDTPASLDPEQEARLLRFVFLLSSEIVNGSRMPHWTSEGRRRRMDVFGN